MTGTLLQLAFPGEQDAYLTINPQITYFRSVHRRNTNFAIECITGRFRGHANFGTRVEHTVEKHAHLMHTVYVHVKIRLNSPPPGFVWVPYAGLKLLKYVSVTIGGHEIEKHTNEWLYIWNQLSQSSGKSAAYDTLVGAESDDATEKEFYIPLQFWFCKDSANALPLVALEHHEVKIIVQFEKFSEMFLTEAPQCTYDFHASLMIDYVFLEIDEARQFACSPKLEYLIHQIQTLSDTIQGNYKQISLPFNHPCKELVWTLQSSKPRSWIDYGLQLEDISSINGNQTTTNDLLTPITLYGGSSSWVDIPADTITIPSGWDIIYNSITGVDDDFFLIPDIGFDLVIEGTNVRYTTEVWTNNFIKFDGQGYASMGTENIYYPDETTPSAFSVHIGSHDYIVRAAAYKSIVENGVNGIVVRIETIAYDEENLQHLCVSETSIFENGNVRFCIPSNAPLCFINAANWGLSDGTKWIYRIANPLEANRGYLLNVNTNYEQTQTFVGAAVPDPSILIINATPIQQESINDIIQSKFSQIIQTTNPNLTDIQTRPDVIYLYDGNIITSAGASKIYTWVQNGSVLYMNTTATDQYINDFFEIFTTLTPVFQFNNNSDTYFAQIATNPIIKQTVMPYINDADNVNGIQPDQIQPDVQILGFGNGTNYAVFMLKRVGAGYVLVDAIQQNGMNYRLAMWNDIYSYILNQNYVSGNPLKTVEVLVNGKPRFKQREGPYFNMVQTYQHHSRIPSNRGIHVYSFSLDPEGTQPSGSLNMSRLDSCNLCIRHSYKTRVSHVKVYARAYNVLQISNGLGGLKYNS
jgi:hypothetical protein